MGNAASTDGQARPEPETRPGLPERVHELYYKVFPGADCPVTGASRAEGEETGPADSRATEVKSKGEGYKHPHVYDVYGKRIDSEAKKAEQGASLTPPLWVYLPRAWEAGEQINPANRMPVTPNQKPAPGQKEVLSTQRVRSSIPKAGTEDTWLYPSPQMFFNSLVRKGKADGVTEKDMEAVVATHNFVNEMTWGSMLRWERLYTKSHPEAASFEPRLLHFRGRPHDLSPKARLRHWLGDPLPFDRHDWMVDRGGREWRYIIDFYYDDEKGGATDAFFVDVRPALDSVPAAILRIQYSLEELKEKLGFGAPVTAQEKAASSPMPQEQH